MTDQRTIILKEYNMETHRTEETGETIGTSKLAQSMTMENFASLLDDFLNRGGKGYREGLMTGLQLRCSHRTMQRLIICFAFGLIAGLSEQEYTDPRNETAIQTAKKVAQMLNAGELPLGLYI